MTQHECQCKECTARRETARAIAEIKKSFPEPEFDWEDLERQCKEQRARDGGKPCKKD